MPCRRRRSPTANWPDPSPAAGPGRRASGRRGRRDDPWFLEPALPPPQRRRGPVERRPTVPDLTTTIAVHTTAPSPTSRGPSRPTPSSGTGSGSSGPRRTGRRSATGPAWTADDLAGAVVLDAGCGMGRYLRVAAEARARLVVGLDLSEAVAAARDLTADLPGVALVRGDLLRPPFAAGTVRPHLLARRARPHARPPRRVPGAGAAAEAGGADRDLGLSPRAARAGADHGRPPRRLDPAAARRCSSALSRLTAPVGGLKRRLMASPNRLVARAGVALNVLTIGVSMHPDPEVRVCDTLDWYAPRYLSRHTARRSAAGSPRPAWSTWSTSPRPGLLPRRPGQRGQPRGPEARSDGREKGVGLGVEAAGGRCCARRHASQSARPHAESASTAKPVPALVM